MIRVAFILRAPEIGGVERQLVELVRGLDPQQFQVGVFPFYPGGGLRHDLETTPGVTVQDMGKRGRWDMAGFLWRLHRAVRAFRPDVIYGCISVANESALLVARLLGRPVVWRFGAAAMDLSMYDWTARPLFTLSRLLSRFPDRIIINSHAGLEYHRRRGYDVSHMVVIPNGFDTARFRHDAAAGQALRAAWNLAPDDQLIGMAARVDPVKNHRLFIDVAARLAARHPRARFVCIGDGSPELLAALQSAAAGAGLGDRLLWPGARHDMPAVYNALDIHCLCSLGEGLPNTVGESMACEVPNAVTDVGDAARLVGDTGRVSPSDDRDGLERSLDALLTLAPADRRALGARARARIIHEYDAPLLARRTSDLLVRLAHPAAASAA